MVKKNLGLVFGILFLNLVLIGMASAVDLTCPLDSKDYDYIIDIDGAKLLSHNNVHGSPSESQVIGVSISSGKYDVTLVAKDEYSGRESITQTHEQYYLSFIKNSNEVAFTSSTSDLEDEVFSAQEEEVVETNFNLPNGADSVQAIHAKTSKSANSLYAVCAGLNKKVTPPQPVCGDGNLDSGEQCDDGNNVNGDGCSSICEIESTTPVCGNGIKEQGEECDGENYCSSSCEIIDDEDNKRSGGIAEFESQFCSPNWECGGWSECYEGVMKRNCVDTNNCNVDYNKPVVQSDCSLPNSAVQENSNNGFVWFFAGIVLFLILLIILVNLLK